MYLFIRDNTLGNKCVFITAVGKLRQHQRAASSTLLNPGLKDEVTPSSEHKHSSCLPLIMVQNAFHMMHDILTLYENVCVKNSRNYLFALLTHVKI